MLYPLDMLTMNIEFRDPAGIVVDDDGTMIVVDSRNHRIQLIDDKLWFAGLVEVKKLHNFTLL